jgi:hypothetical protein
MTRWGLELALWGAETAQRVEVTRWGLELAVWGGRDRPTSRDDSLGVVVDSAGGGGRKKAPNVS